MTQERSESPLAARTRLGPNRMFFEGLDYGSLRDHSWSCI